MTEIDVKASTWKLVEVGRIVLFQRGKYAGRLAAVVEIIDHKRVYPKWSSELGAPKFTHSQVLVDGAEKEHPVPRHAAALADTRLTPIVIPKLPRAVGHGALAAAWAKADVDTKWKEGGWAKKIEQREKRKSLTDFERFKVMKLKKQVS
jgi:large subunit ribosomal protein L14e